ncbi:hypothetical protein TYRP_013629 [Tyrophagus putrescentiae]|nr:hypothetical protein TYRP_013629 [Tyrophagus putrescentiae]
MTFYLAYLPTLLCFCNLPGFCFEWLDLLALLEATACATLACDSFSFSCLSAVCFLLSREASRQMKVQLTSRRRLNTTTAMINPVFVETVTSQRTRFSGAKVTEVLRHLRSYSLRVSSLMKCSTRAPSSAHWAQVVFTTQTAILIQMLQYMPMVQVYVDVLEGAVSQLELVDALLVHLSGGVQTEEAAAVGIVIFAASAAVGNGRTSGACLCSWFPFELSIMVKVYVVVVIVRSTNVSILQTFLAGTRLDEKLMALVEYFNIKYMFY